MSLYARFAEEYEQIFPFRDEVYRFLLGQAGDPGSSVLDVGCGPGHYCGQFLHDGYIATGVDLDDAMIAVAERRYPEGSFRCLDMQSIEEVGGGFRCIYSIGNVAAHLPREAFFRFISTLYEMLVSGGTWIMQVMNWDPLMELHDYEFPVRTIDRAGRPATFHRRYDAIGPQTLTFSVSLRSSDDEFFAERTTLFPVSAADYLRMHEAAGFECRQASGDFSGAPIRQVPGTGLVMVFVKSWPDQL